MKLTRAQRRELRAQLAEGVHTAFRKASDHPNAHQIWMLIRDLPSKEWGAIINFVVWGITGHDD